jgi:hypothetical protein
MGVFVLLMGFPGVGKLTIATELSSLFPAKIIDNHWFNNPILRLLDDDGTTPLPPGVWEYTARVRQAVLDAIVAYRPSPANFIFTHAGIAGDEQCSHVSADLRCRPTMRGVAGADQIALR